MVSHVPVSYCGLQIYGKTSRRQAVEKLRAETLSGGPLDQTSGAHVHSCVLRNVMVNEAAKIHGQLMVGSLQVSRRKIAPNYHSESVVQLDLEEVRGTNRMCVS